MVEMEHTTRDILMKIRGKRISSIIPLGGGIRGGTIEISASRWSPVINRIVSDPLDQPPANRYLERPVQGGSHANSRLSHGWIKLSFLLLLSPPFSCTGGSPVLAQLDRSFTRYLRDALPIFSSRIEKFFRETGASEREGYTACIEEVIDTITIICCELLLLITTDIGNVRVYLDRRFDYRVVSFLAPS